MKSIGSSVGLSLMLILSVILPACGGSSATDQQGSLVSLPPASAITVDVGQVRRGETISENAQQNEGSQPASGSSGLQLSTIESETYSPSTSYRNDFCSSGVYPAQWIWNPESIQQKPVPADLGTPKITQIRNGKIIATYREFGGDAGYSKINSTDGGDTTVGPFRRKPYLQWKPGDIFEVDPAIYSGPNMQIYIGPNSADGTAEKTLVPSNITIRGKIINGKRPVIINPPSGASTSNYNQSLIYIEGRTNSAGVREPATDITIENLDIVDTASGGYIGKAAIYVNGAHNLTMRNVRIAGFKQHKANGIFATGNNSGTLLLENVELASNGGNNGPEHNAYINSSNSDPNFTFKVVGSWSRDAYYGHAIKSRAQRTIIEGSYFSGQQAVPGTQTETYLLDVPNGGILVARNNIFVKGYSGNQSNGASITFGVESANLDREWGLTIEHNTFVALSRYYDEDKHQLFPMFLKSNVPGARTVNANAYIGYCSTGNTAKDYRGTDPAILDFNEIDLAFRPRQPRLSGTSSIVGTYGYAHNAVAVKRKTNAIGARD